APLKKSKSVALQSTKTSSKALKAKLVEIEEESSIDGQYEELEDEDFTLFTRNSGYKDKKEDQKSGFHCKKPGHFIADCP
ncbi:serine/threonine protein kinase SRPK1, partial [Trifolium medium]|nr:serine/threonine protein kinase SRPK1 [Trifolium medium]